MPARQCTAPSCSTPPAQSTETSPSAQLPAFMDLLSDGLSKLKLRPYKRKQQRDGPYTAVRRGSKVMKKWSTAKCVGTLSNYQGEWWTERFALLLFVLFVCLFIGFFGGSLLVRCLYGEYWFVKGCGEAQRTKDHTFDRQLFVDFYHGGSKVIFQYEKVKIVKFKNLGC